jgi:hypothetical protein
VFFKEGLFFARIHTLIGHNVNFLCKTAQNYVQTSFKNFFFRQSDHMHEKNLNLTIRETEVQSMNYLTGDLSLKLLSQ